MLQKEVTHEITRQSTQPLQQHYYSHLLQPSLLPRAPLCLLKDASTSHRSSCGLTTSRQDIELLTLLGRCGYCRRCYLIGERQQMSAIKAKQEEKKSDNADKEHFKER